MKIVFATGNKGKLREASEILGESFELITPAEMGVTEEIPETGDSIIANSRQKADYLWNRCKCACFADDTGLEVDVLGGEPGVNTARYAGVGKDFNQNIDKLLYNLEVAETEAHMAAAMGLRLREGSLRKARFRSVVTLIIDGQRHYFDGVLEGEIARVRSGCGGFGYDPVFIPCEYLDKTLAEISEEEKNEISHRGKALRAMAEYLQSVKY